MVTSPILITINPSHFCEKARWALQRAGRSFREEVHAPLFHMAATVPRGGRSTPLLISGSTVLRDSSAIVRHADQLLAEPDRLFPSDGKLAAEVVEWDRRFGEYLGPHVRRWAYGYVLEDAALTRDLLEARVAATEARLFRAMRPLVVGLMKRNMKIAPSGCARSLEKVRTIFAEVSERLVDGRKYLVGERFTAADLAFAALGAPAVRPAEYGAPMPGEERLPSGMRAEADQLRATPAGQFILRLYRDERRRVIPS